MKKIALIILFINLSWMLTLAPYVNSNYHSDTDLYPYMDINLFYVGIGAKLDFHTEYVNLESDISYNFFDCLNERPNDFNPNQGFGALENNEGLSSNQFNYFFTSMKINYNKSNFDFYVALDNPTWGPGVNKIVLSDKAPPFFNIGYKWKLTEKISYEHLYGKLNSLIEDSLYSDSYASETSRYFELPRIIGAHKIEYAFSDFINFGLFEIIIYGGNRSVEPYYLLPFVPFLPIQTYLGDIDNDLLGGYFNLNLKNNFNLYSTLVIDEWTPPHTFNKEHKNWFIYQIGISKKNIFADNSRFILEYIWSDNRVYNHKVSINNFYSYDYPLGFWAGPHAEQLYIAYFLTVNKFDFNIEFSNSKRGESVSGYYDNFVDRYSGIVEKKQNIKLLVNYRYNKKLEFNFGLSIINWKNAGFDPLNENSFTDDIIKKDIQFGINYHFKDYNL